MLSSARDALAARSRSGLSRQTDAHQLSGAFMVAHLPQFSNEAVSAGEDVRESGGEVIQALPGFVVFALPQIDWHTIEWGRPKSAQICASA